MKKNKIVVLSLLALAFARQPGFCTANATAERRLDDHKVEELKEVAAQYKVEITAEMKKADIVAAIKSAPGYAVDRMAAMEQRFDDLTAENARLQAAAGSGASAGSDAPQGELALLVKGAGVDYKDVGWRIRAGLSPAQAVEVALAEKLERESNEANTKGAKK